MPYAFKQLLEKAAGGIAPGPSPTFSVFHLVLALEIIASKTTGRIKLAEDLRVGEGAMRTMLSRLRDAGLVKISKSGCSLTEKGRRIWKEYSMAAVKVRIGKSELSLGDHNYAILVRNRGRKVKSGMEQRDAAVIVGATSVTTMKMEKGRMVIPSVSNNVAGDFPKAAACLVELLHPEDDDAIVIGSSGTQEKAERGALAAAWTLLGDS